MFRIVRVYFWRRGFGFVVPLPYSGPRELYYHITDVPGDVEFAPGDGVAFQTILDRRREKCVGVQAASVDPEQRADAIRMIEKLQGAF